MRNEAFGVELEAARKDKKYVMHKNKKLKSEKKKAEKKIAVVIKLYIFFNESKLKAK
jgi:uncharacterized protein (DUF3084 family)